MSTQQMGTQIQRIGKFKGRIYENALPVERLARFGRSEKMPSNNGETYVGRRYLPYGATSGTANSINQFFSNGAGDRIAAVLVAHQSQEGVTGAPDHLIAIDTTVNITEYSCLYSYTNRTSMFYEDDLPAEQVKQCGRRMAFVNEMVIFMALKSCTNVFYGGSGTSLSTVNGELTRQLQLKMLRALDANHASEITSMLEASPKYGTEAVAAGYIAAVHTDLDATIQDMPGYKSPELYASGKPMDGELGKVGRVRYIGHPDLVAQQDAGALTSAAPSMLSTGGTNVDVYSGILMADNAWSHIVLRGTNVMDPTHIKSSEKTKSDPHGKLGYVGAMWHKAVMLENNGWMAAFHVCAKAL